MSSFIEIGLKKTLKDALGESVKADIKDDLGIKTVKKVLFVESYSFPTTISKEKLIELAENVFVDSVMQVYSVNKPIHKKFDWEIIVSYHKEVTDNIGLMAKKALSDYGVNLNENEDVRFSKKFILFGKISKKEIEKICVGLLANPLVENYSYRKGKK